MAHRGDETRQVRPRCANLPHLPVALPACAAQRPVLALHDIVVMDGLVSPRLAPAELSQFYTGDSYIMLVVCRRRNPRGRVRSDRRARRRGGGGQF